MFHKKAPFRGKNVNEVKASMGKKELKFIKNLDNDLIKAIVSMLKIYPKDRPKINEILALPFFQQFLSSEEIDSLNLIDKKGTQKRMG